MHFVRVFNKATGKTVWQGDFDIEVESAREAALRCGTDPALCVKGEVDADLQNDPNWRPVGKQKEKTSRTPSTLRPVKGSLLTLMQAPSGAAAAGVWLALCQRSQKRQKRIFQVSRAYLAGATDRSPYLITKTLALLERAGWIKRYHTRKRSASGPPITILRIKLLNLKLAPWRPHA